MSKWIPVKFKTDKYGNYIYLSKMPKNNEKVLITDYSNDVRIDICNKEEINDIYTQSGNDYAERVVAWMPLPEPYKPESEN